MKLSDSKTEIVRRGNKVVYDCGDRIAKVFNATKPVSDVFNEALNLARIGETGIRVPKILEVSESDEGWALATEKVPGTTLAERMRADAKNEATYLEQFVRLQLEINGHTAPLLNRQKDKYARMINGLTEIDATTRYELLIRLDGMKPESKVCHGDYNPTNVIVGEDGLLYVCDWAHATQGSPAADAAMTYLLLALEDLDRADKYLIMFCKMADMPMQIVRRWTSIVAATELARHRDAREEEFLRSWIDVAEYQ